LAAALAFGGSYLYLAILKLLSIKTDLDVATVGGYIIKGIMVTALAMVAIYLIVSLYNIWG
jgi:hypothetical protein